MHIVLVGKANTVTFYSNQTAMQPSYRCLKLLISTCFTDLNPRSIRGIEQNKF